MALIFPFAPDPDLTALGLQVDTSPMKEGMMETYDRLSSGKSSVSTMSGGIDHEFKFLRTKIGVWSCLKASWMRLHKLLGVEKLMIQMIDTTTIH